MMDNNRVFWNQNQKTLRQYLEKGIDHKKSIEILLDQHAMVHSARMSRTKLHSFEDEIFENIDYESARIIPAKFRHSIVWIIWHLARIEDITMNLLVAGKTQIFNKSNWFDRIGIKNCQTGNGMNVSEIAGISKKIDIGSLRAYRMAVGRNTRKIVSKLQSGHFKEKVESNRIKMIWTEKALPKSAKGIVDYWSKRTIAGLLLMPSTRHCFLHLNEARRIKEKIIKLL
jgi:hypothetical protein